MECFGTTDFDNNSRFITSAIIISGLHCNTKLALYVVSLQDLFEPRMNFKDAEGCIIGGTDMECT